MLLFDYPLAGKYKGVSDYTTNFSPVNHFSKYFFSGCVLSTALCRPPFLYTSGITLVMFLSLGVPDLLFNLVVHVHKY